VFDYLYISLTRAPSDGGIIVARTEAFEALPDDLKLIVDLASESVRDVYYDYSIVRVAEAMQQIKDYGATVERLPKEIEDAFLATAETYIDEKVAKEPPFFGRVVESQRAFKKLCEAQGIY
jgi:TRAP-type mannitol/chloroaromatic compound transport system substrate-binding protein